MQRNHLVRQRWHMVTVNNNKQLFARTTTQQTQYREKQKQSEAVQAGRTPSQSTWFLLDHMCGVRSRAAAAVGTQQTTHVSRVVGREVQNPGSTLQTPQMFFTTPGRPAGVEREHTSTLDLAHRPRPPRIDLQPDLRSWALRRSGRFRGDERHLDFPEVSWIREACGSVFMFIGWMREEGLCTSDVTGGLTFL